jgi:DNA polymerase elongation subunit (family B)
MEHTFKLFEFNIYNDKNTELSSDEDDREKINKDKSTFVIQMFGINEQGEKASIIVQEYQPFFYVKVPNSWGQKMKTAFQDHLKAKVGKYYENSITECKLIEKKKLYEFDAGKLHRFILIKFANVPAYNKVKNFWYRDVIDEQGLKEWRLIDKGYFFKDCFIELYEANIPPLLRFFHLREVSPSGWVALPHKKTREIMRSKKRTSCDYEFVINYKNVIPLNDKETRVPYKIMSFDIEANSSHGDFPVPIKSYKKLATNIVDYFAKNKDTDLTVAKCQTLLRAIIKTAFGHSLEDQVPSIDIVYPKQRQHVGGMEDSKLEDSINAWLQTKVRDRVTNGSDAHQIESLFENANKALQDAPVEGEEEGFDAGSDAGSDDELVEDDVPMFKVGSGFKPESYKNKQSTIVDIMCDKKFEREGKIIELIVSLSNNFPQLEGDKVTFIGSTFTRYGEKEPYLNHCIILNTCDTLEGTVNLSEIETYETEAEVLCAWTALVQRENPDIVIGYNIFSFDYEFMFRRAQELNCVEDFLKLSRNHDELCAIVDYKTGKLDIDRSSTTFASGTYDLSIIKMNGRLQVDMLNWFRRTEILSSYKLDYVGGHFIGDYVKSLEHIETNQLYTRFKTTNMTGLQVNSFIHFEEINHSSDYYKGGNKFRVTKINTEEKWFEIEGHENPQAKAVKWGLAKDDVTPKDIFRMTNEGPTARAVIAKYCIQDCNLVQHLFAKVDVVTDLVEMSKLCSVPMSFLIYRGQGIKLTSYVAKKCKEKGVLMPVINKGSKDDGYEGAIVLEPKCGLYLDTPVPVGDFASLYPSSMLSENLCPSSKVWTKIYDLANNLIAETGEKFLGTDNKDLGQRTTSEKKADLGTSQYVYDNLPGYEYVDITFDTYRYVRKSPKAKAEKIRSGHKVCRFAQPLKVNGIKGLVEEKAIMPSILQELLKARKDTRKQIPLTSDDFMKNVLDKRQLAYKVTANSLYGQLGAKTSTFYEPDIAAATTATGRLLLTYAKRVVEECYEDIDVDTKYGLVNTKAEYVYGDSVANYTPVYVSTFKKNELTRVVDILTIEQLAEKYGENLWIKCIEPGKQEKEFCELEGVETWTEKGWTRLHRVIRHALAPWKKMVRILTHTGCVDVTDDHSLITKEGKEISPKDLQIGTELLHNPLREKAESNFYTDEDIVHFDDTLDTASMYRVPIAASATEYGVNLLFDNMLDAAIHTNYLNHRNIPFRLTSCPDLSIIVHQINTKLYNKYNPNSIKSMEEIPYEGYVYDLTTDNHHFAAGVGNMIVHNTDSVFFKFNLLNKETGEPILGPKALELSIEIAQSACHTVSKFLKQPHDFEYEKTFMPFCLLSKKRYVGIKYETDPTKGKRNEMGIVLKRRDNAPIVKDVYGGVIDILMKECNVQKAIEYVNQCLQEIVDGNVSIEKLIITKSLRSFYKNPQQIAHKVLADRIAAREPGNKPTSGDRIPFAYIVQPNKKALQGEKIETPTYIKEKGLQLDYSFYITNQIMKPLLQLFGLVLEDIWRMQNKSSKISKFRREIVELRRGLDDNKKFEDKLSKMRDKEVKTLIFDKYLRETNNAKEGNQSVTKFFPKK